MSHDTGRTTFRERQLTVAAGALMAVQLMHGAIPGPANENASVVGTVAGVLLLLAAATSLLGAVAHRWWARPVLGWTGAIVAAGFLLYHAIPVKTPLNYPYWGTTGPANVGQWVPVVVAMAVGCWCAWEAFSPTADGHAASSLRNS